MIEQTLAMRLAVMADRIAKMIRDLDEEGRTGALEFEDVFAVSFDLVSAEAALRVIISDTR